MNATGWTLAYNPNYPAVGTATVALEALGALEGGPVTGDGIRFRFASHRQSTVTIRLPGIDPKVAPQIPFESPVTIYQGPGATNPMFQGRRIDRSGVASPGSTGVEYTFADAWYDLDHITFKQASNVPGFQPWPDCVLFQENTPGVNLGGYVKTSDQLNRVLVAAIAVGVNLQVGTIDLCPVQPSQTAPYGLYVPFYPIRCVKMSEAIKICLRVHPDCFTEIDYSTTPPTFNVRRRAVLVAKTLPYAQVDANGLRHVATDIQPRPELQPRRVSVFYQQTATVNGTPAVSFVSDTYPVGATDGVRALDYSVNLAGPTEKVTTAVLNTLAFNPNSLALWKLKCQPLASSDIPPNGSGSLAFASTPNVTVKDNIGNAINLSNFGFYIQNGTVATWMVVNVVEANVSADFTYSKLMPDGVTVKEVNGKHTHHFRINLCNWDSVNGGNTFQFRQVLSAGEVIPLGLAQGVYTALATLQYSLSHTLREDAGFQGFVKPGKHAINLAGGAAAWTTMNAALQTTDYTLFASGTGKVFSRFQVRCGPVEQLEAGQLVELLNIFANRRMAEIDTSSRITGTLSGAVTPMPTNTDKENSTSETPNQLLNRLRATTADGNGNFTDILFDARTSGLFIAKYKSNGQVDTTQPQVQVDLSLMDPTQLTAGKLILKPVLTPSATTGQFCYVLATDVPAGSGGGGGNVWL